MMRKTLLVSFLALGLLAAACSAPQPAPAQPGGPKAAQDESKPQYGGALSTVVVADPFDFDMSIGGKTGVNDAVLSQVYEGLLQFKNGPDVKYTDQVIVPRLAESWEISPDARTFTFHLRKGVKFANLPPVSGRDLTASDVKWSYEYYSRTGEFEGKKLPKSAIDFMFEGLQGIDAPDPYTVVLHFKDPFSPFLSYAASQWTRIAPREIQQQDGDLKSRAVGTGPFQLDTTASQKGSRWVLKKNPSYWDSGKPYLDEIRDLVISEDATQRAAFQTHQLDIIPAVDSYNELQELSKANPQAVTFEYLQSKGYHLYFTQARRGPFDDVRVRRAFAMAIDRDEVNRVMSGGKGAWAVTGALPGLFTDEETRQLMRYDPDGARRLLQEANYPFDMDLEWTNTTEGGVYNQTLIPLVQDQLRRVGIKSTLKLMPREEQRPKKYAGDYDLDMDFATGAFEADIDSMLFAYYSTSALNWSHINDPELDRLLLAQRQEPDQAKRREIIRNAIKRIVDQAWGTDIIYPVKGYVWQLYVKGYYPQYARRYPEAFTWLEK